MMDKPRTHERNKWLTERLNDVREAFDIACEFARLEQEKETELSTLKQAMSTIAKCDAPAWVFRIIAMRALRGECIHSFQIDRIEPTYGERIALKELGISFNGSPLDAPFPQTRASVVTDSGQSQKPAPMSQEKRVMSATPKLVPAERIRGLDPGDQPQRVFKPQSEWANK